MARTSCVSSFWLNFKRHTSFMEKSFAILFIFWMGSHVSRFLLYFFPAYKTKSFSLLLVPRKQLSHLFATRPNNLHFIYTYIRNRKVYTAVNMKRDLYFFSFAYVKQKNCTNWVETQCKARIVNMTKWRVDMLHIHHYPMLRNIHISTCYD